MNLLTEEIREEFISLYFQRSKESFIIKYLELQNDLNEQRIEKHKQILNKLEKKLGLKTEIDSKVTKTGKN